MRTMKATEYTGNGYEVSAQYCDEIKLNCALERWRGSEGHHKVILNRGTWENVERLAIDGAISEHYAVVWFGKEHDSDLIILSY